MERLVAISNRCKMSKFDLTVDLVTGVNMGNVGHDTKIDWLEVCKAQNYFFLYNYKKLYNIKI